MYSDDDDHPLRVIATVGLHGSASTWAFNVVRELAVSHYGEQQVAALYADKVDERPEQMADGRRCLVIKSHQGSAGLHAWLVAVEAQLILSIRDPRDAALSMAQRFEAPLDHAAAWLATDCDRMMRLASQGHAVLRYEDRFFDDPAAPAHIAQLLGLTPDPSRVAEIFTRYRTEAVRRFAERLADAPPATIERQTASWVDKLTQIHSVHIGDGRSGKWRDLPEADQSRMSTLFQPFLQRFGYV